MLQVWGYSKRNECSDVRCGTYLSFQVGQVTLRQFAFQFLVGLKAKEVAYELIGSAGDHSAVPAHECKRASTRNKYVLTKKAFGQCCRVCPAHRSLALQQDRGERNPSGDFSRLRRLIHSGRMRFGTSIWGSDVGHHVS